MRDNFAVVQNNEVFLNFVMYKIKQWRKDNSSSNLKTKSDH